MQQKSNLVSIWLVVLLMVSGMAGCENSFEPFEENYGLHFTLFGALDLSADTQWVRVMPIMDSLVSRSSKPIDAQVSLTRLSDGQKTILNDSLFKFRDEFYAWNFWTTVPLQEGGEYRIEAKASDGRTSSATFTIPPDFPTPLVEYYPRNETGRVYGSGVERVVVASGIYYVQTISDHGEILRQWVHVPHAYEVEYFGNNNFQFTLNDQRTIAERLGVSTLGITILEREVLVASGTSDWPDFEGLLREE